MSEALAPCPVCGGFLAQDVTDIDTQATFSNFYCPTCGWTQNNTNGSGTGTAEDENSNAIWGISQDVDAVPPPITLPSRPITRADLGNLHVDSFRRYRRKRRPLAARVAGVFSVETQSGVVHCRDGYLVIDENGLPVPMAVDEFEATYEACNEFGNRKI